jgi:hypothetical protein
MSERSPEILRPAFEFRPEVQPETICLQTWLRENEGRSTSELVLPEDGVLVECTVAGCAMSALVMEQAGVLVSAGQSQTSTCVY